MFRVIFILTFLIVLAFETLLFFGGILMLNGMSCDSASKMAGQCYTFAWIATSVYVVISLLIPTLSLIWVLKHPQSTRSKITAFVLLLLSPVIAILANIAVLALGSIF